MGTHRNRSKSGHSQVALIPAAPSRRSVAPRVNMHRYGPLQRIRSLFLSESPDSSTDSAPNSVAKPYFFCPLCHHQFSASNVPNASFAYPQAEYFRSLAGDRGSAAANHTFGYYASYFVEIRKLSRGRFGAVFVCQHVLNDVPLGLFAVKKIPVGDDTTYLTKVLREVRILENMKKHPNVVEYNHSWIDTARTADFGPYTRCLFILMEFATEGSLDDYLSRHGAVLSNMLVWYFFLSAVAGVNHLHHHDILHCDLKPQNLLLTATGDNALPRLMVSDFGASCFEAAAQGPSPVRGCTGTEEYMAPELFEASARSNAHTYRYSKASDMWSLGVILHFLMAGGNLPQFDRATAQVRFHPSVNSRPQEMRSMLKGLLMELPSQRPSCADILNADVVQSLRREMMRDVSSEGGREFVFTGMHAERPSQGGNGGQTPLPSPSLQPQIVYSSQNSVAQQDGANAAGFAESMLLGAFGSMQRRVAGVAGAHVQVPVSVLSAVFCVLYYLVMIKS